MSAFFRQGDDAEHFRSRAKQCRALAKDARNADDRETLGRMADNLEAEARLVDAEEATKPTGGR